MEQVPYYGELLPGPCDLAFGTSDLVSVQGLGSLVRNLLASPAEIRASPLELI